MVPALLQLDLETQETAVHSMLLSRVYCAAALFSVAFAAIDLLQILQDTPPCATNCTLSILPAAGCPITEMDSCLCENNDLQKTLAICVLERCSLQEQYNATTVRQELICKGKHQESRTKDITLAFIILAVFTYPIVILRFISRWTIARKIWWDDWCILVATIGLIPLTILPFLHVYDGFGKHFWDVKPERIVPLRKAYYAVQMIYCAVLTLSKISILFLYLRIFTDKIFRRVIVASMCFLFAHGTIYLFCIGLQCLPVRAIWTMEPATCLNLQAMVFSGAGLSIFEDFFIMVLPVWELMKLNLSKKRKAALVFMFALGSFASITSIVRLRYIAKFGNSADVTWDNIDTVIWSDIEIFVAVICASIICVRPLIAKVFASVVQSVSNSLGMSRVSESLPASHKSSKVSKHSNRWSETLAGKIAPTRNSGHIQLQNQNIAESGLKAKTSRDELGKSPSGGSDDTVIKVWITRNASVERGSIHVDDTNPVVDHLSPTFRGRNLVEVNLPFSREVESGTARMSGMSGSTLHKDQESARMSSSVMGGFASNKDRESASMSGSASNKDLERGDG